MKKNKILAGIVALSMMIPCSSAFAETKMWNDGFINPQNNIQNIHENIIGEYPAAGEDVYWDGGVDVVFNGDYIAFSDASPINDNGRVKLPFRELLEKMGASVDFDEASRKITAVRNNVKIEFSADSNVISVNKDGNLSEFTMDTSIDVINDRTFVPVRFMAEAFGLSVGWDDNFDAVVITDTDAYVDRLTSECSNYMQLGELGCNMNNYNSNQKIQLSFDMENAFSDTPSVSNIKLDLTSQTSADKNIIDNYNLLNISSFNLIEQGKPMNLEDVEFRFILNGNKIYISTNLVEIMKKMNPDDVMLDIAASIVNDGTWLEGDIDELLVDYLGMDEASAEMIVSALTEPQSFTNALSAAFASFDENSVLSAIAAKTQVETMSALFGNDLFHLNQNADGSYSFDYKLDTNTFVNFIAKSIGGSGALSAEMPDLNSLVAELGLNMDLTMNGSISDSKMVSNVSMGFSVNNEDASVSFTMSAQSDTDIGVVDFTGYSFPENTTSLSTILSVLKSQMD